MGMEELYNSKVQSGAIKNESSPVLSSDSDKFMTTADRAQIELNRQAQERREKTMTTAERAQKFTNEYKQREQQTQSFREGSHSVAQAMANATKSAMQEYVPNGTAADAAYYEGQKRNQAVKDAQRNDAKQTVKNALLGHTIRNSGYTPNGTAADEAYYKKDEYAEAYDSYNYPKRDPKAYIENLYDECAKQWVTDKIIEQRWMEYRDEHEGHRGQMDYEAERAFKDSHQPTEEELQKGLDEFKNNPSFMDEMAVLDMFGGKVNHGEAHTIHQFYKYNDSAYDVISGFMKEKTDSLMNRVDNIENESFSEFDKTLAYEAFGDGDAYTLDKDSPAFEYMLRGFMCMSSYELADGCTKITSMERVMPETQQKIAVGVDTVKQEADNTKQGQPVDRSNVVVGPVAEDDFVSAPVDGPNVD